MKNTVTVRSGAWYGDNELTLSVPANWHIEMLNPKDAPALTTTQIEVAIAETIGTKPISELAKNKKSATIIVDDMSRPTPAYQVIPFLIRELNRAGVPKSEIRFVVGVGGHRPISDEEMVKKLGADIVAEYEVTNHDFLSRDLRGLGNLENGTPLYINRTVADADFKMCLGGIYPHSSVGFSGGAKLIVPGTAGFSTMYYFHKFPPGRGPAVIEGEGDEPDRRDTIEMAAAVLGLDAIANVVLNSRREISGLFVGDFIKAHRKAAHFALDTYNTKILESTRTASDLVIINCYPLDADAIQLDKALAAFSYFENAYTMALYPATDGSCFHGLFDRLDYPKYVRQKIERLPTKPTPEPKLGRQSQLHVWSEHFDRDDFYKEYPSSLLFRDLDQLIRLMAEKLPSHAKVAILPAAGIQVLQ